METDNSQSSGSLIIYEFIARIHTNVDVEESSHQQHNIPGPYSCFWRLGSSQAVLPEFILPKERMLLVDMKPLSREFLVSNFDIPNKPFCVRFVQEKAKKANS